MPPESDDAAGDVEVVPTALTGELEHLRSRAATYAGKAQAEATKRAYRTYRTDCTGFISWRSHKASLPAPPSP